MKIRFVFLFLLCFLKGFCCVAQEKTIHLPTISVSAPYQLSCKSDNAELLDSGQFSNGIQNLGGLLAHRSSAYVKNYGPGNISTIALRGTAAAHTAIIWKGVPVNNSMLGSTDLSQINGAILNHAKIQEGGCGQMAVTENFGGILVLGENQKLSKEEDFFALNFGLGSFQTIQNQFSSRFRLFNATLGLKVWNLFSANDFKYKIEGLEKRQKHASRQNRGVEADFELPISKNLNLESAIWIQRNESEIPPSLYQEMSAARQNDENLRISNRLKWNYGKVQITAGQGFTNDVLNYYDPLSFIDSKSEVQNHLAWLEGKRENKNWSISGNFWTSLSTARTNNYSGEAVSNRMAFTGIVAYQFPKIPLRLNGQIRAEQYRFSQISRDQNAFLPSFSLDWTAGNYGVLRAGIHKKMRLPTLNDLYWSPGGNPDLVPETGWTSDFLFLKNVKVSKQIFLESEAQAYHSQINHYIQWLPNGYIWKPENVAQVQILGFGLSEKLSFRRERQEFYLFVNFHLTRSVNSEKRFEGDESKGKQLIYIPLWQNLVKVGWIHRNIDFQVWYQQTEKRFIDPSNSGFLNGFNTLNARFSLRVKSKQDFEFNFFGEGLNLSETQYQMVAGFPMPLRQFSGGVQIKFL